MKPVEEPAEKQGAYYRAQTETALHDIHVPVFPARKRVRKSRTAYGFADTVTHPQNKNTGNKNDYRTGEGAYKTPAAKNRHKNEQCGFLADTIRHPAEGDGGRGNGYVLETYQNSHYRGIKGKFAGYSEKHKIETAKFNAEEESKARDGKYQQTPAVFVYRNDPASRMAFAVSSIPR
jgi:hypothetical protein